MTCYFPKRIGGYVNIDGSGFSGAFSWWRNLEKAGVWSVCDHTGFGSRYIDYAVVDDFGNLVRVNT